MSKKYQVVLVAEDGEYVQEEFTSALAANNYIVANAWHYGEGQKLIMRVCSNEWPCY